ncbi:MAG: hypothetical protein QOI56_2030, partial [Actinomycetota bacterium]|nr:hypothetical protein [Actinomycetota bacterium]
QVDDLVAGRIQAAWNSPLAWVRTARCVPGARAFVMRDTDQDLTSVVVVRAESDVSSVGDLTGRTVAVGAVDSPQSALIPLSHLRSMGAGDVKVRRFDVGVGLHGDHIGGEREAARTLAAGEVDAACMIDANHLLFVREGTLAPGSTRVLVQTAPYDHCNMTVGDGSDALADEIERFGRLLLAMSYADPGVRPLLDLEGLTRWLPGRTSGYGALEAAVDETGFYDAAGNVTAPGYDP